MRCSRIACALLSAAIAGCMPGIASAISHMGTAADLSKISIIGIGQSLNRFENVKDRRTLSFMDKLTDIRNREDTLPRKNAIAFAVAYASKLNETILRDSAKLKSILSSKMMDLLSVHWANKQISTDKESDGSSREIKQSSPPTDGNKSDNSNKPKDFTSIENMTGKVGLRYFGSIGYSCIASLLGPIRKSDIGVFWQSQCLALAEFVNRSVSSNTIGYVEEKYSGKYGSAVEMSFDNTWPANIGLEANSFLFSKMPMKFEQDVKFIDKFAARYGLYDPHGFVGGMDYSWLGQNDLVLWTNTPTQIDFLLEMWKTAPHSVKTPSKTLLQSTMYWLNNKAEKWHGAFHRIAVQFSSIRWAF